jgi:hypothetical protein
VAWLRDLVDDLPRLLRAVTQAHIASSVKILSVFPAVIQYIEDQIHLQPIALVLHGLSIAIRQVQREHG